MSYDGFFTHTMTAELREKLIGGHISKVYQPFLQELQLIIRNNRTNFRLQASVHPSYYRLHLTEERPNNPQQAPMFCMLMRKHLESASIDDIYQIDNDRIIVFALTGRDEIGIQVQFLLYFELMGRHSNIVLVNPETNRIIDCIKHVPGSMNTYRTLQAGADYRLPPANDQQTNILALNSEDIRQFAVDYQETIQSGKGSQIIQGLSSFANKQILDWLRQGFKVEEALKLFIEWVKKPQGTIFTGDKTLAFYFTDLPYLPGQREIYPSLSETLDNFYKDKVHFDRIQQMTGNLNQQIEQIISKNQKKLKNLAKDRKVAQKADSYKIYGELLSAYSHQFNKGQSEVEVHNYYDDQKMIIPLDPRKTPIENSQAYYKKYSKYRDSLKYISQQENIAIQEINYFDSILVQLRQADLDDIEDIKAELQDQGYLRQSHKNVKKRAKTKSKPRRYRSSDGVLIYVGRNNQQNDELSLKKASKNHWWFHTKDIPGAHVIVESDHPSDQTMTEAAEIAAYHSKSQYSSNVPVDTVQVRQLRKPNGAKPGFVIYEGQKTLFVTPVEKKIMAMEIK